MLKMKNILKQEITNNREVIINYILSLIPWKTP